MESLPVISLKEIAKRLKSEDFPFSGITETGSAEFHFNEPVRYLGVALHAGGRVREELNEVMAVDPGDRYREEDPFSERFIHNFPIQIIARDSRFEYDLNWEIEKSIYDFDKSKWGLKVWTRRLTESEIEISNGKFREFHELLDLIVEFLLTKYGEILLFDLHTYCYQRDAKALWWEDPKPDVNLGTKSVNRDNFTAIIDFLLDDLSNHRLSGHRLRIAENKIFPGGYLSRKFSRLYPEQVLVLALEYKKMFMDEWTGELFEDQLDLLVDQFTDTVERSVIFFNS